VAPSSSFSVGASTVAPSSSFSVGAWASLTVCSAAALLVILSLALFRMSLTLSEFNILLRIDA
jgi:hypothetical protein